MSTGRVEHVNYLYAPQARMQTVCDEKEGRKEEEKERKEEEGRKRERGRGKGGRRRGERKRSWAPQAPAQAGNKAYWTT